MNILLMYKPSSVHFQELKMAAPAATFFIAESIKDAQEKIREADAVLGNRYFLQSFPFAKKLKWMQSGSSGMDLILNEQTLAHPVQITSTRGIYDDEVADHAIALIFALLRGIHLFRDAQKNCHWKQRPLARISQTRSFILGWGGIGQEIAKKLLALGSQVYAAALKTQDSKIPKIPLLSRDEWEQLLPQIDFLILALPLTPLTRHIVSKDVLEKMHPGANLVNVGRGETVDELSLLDRIQNNYLAGAALDVFKTEPLKSDHPFWHEEKILLTPHVGRSRETAPYRWESLFVENLHRFYSKKPLLNPVDKQAGY